MNNLEDITELVQLEEEIEPSYNDIENRIYWINDEIKKISIDLFNNIMKWNREDQGKPIEERRPIKILFDSTGGSLDAANILSNVIEISTTPIYGYAIGIVGSGASLIYLSCHKKFALPSTYFVVHRGSCDDLGGNYNELKALMNDYDKLIKIMEDFYLTHLKIDQKELKEKISTDWYVREKDLEKYGFVDKIITSIEDIIGKNEC